jgi:hypothetical protein
MHRRPHPPSSQIQPLHLHAKNRALLPFSCPHAQRASLSPPAPFPPPPKLHPLAMARLVTRSESTPTTGDAARNAAAANAMAAAGATVPAICRNDPQAPLQSNHAPPQQQFAQSSETLDYPQSLQLQRPREALSYESFAQPPLQPQHLPNASIIPRPPRVAGAIHQSPPHERKHFTHSCGQTTAGRRCCRLSYMLILGTTRRDGRSKRCQM